VLRQALALLALGWTLAAPAAATVSAGSVSTTFSVDVQGSQRTVVTSARRTIDDLGCAVRRSDVERQTLEFTTRTPGRLAAARGRPSSTAVAVVVRATGTKQRRRTVSGAAPECDVAPQTAETLCGPAAYAGRATVALPTFGSVRLSGAPVRPGDAAQCATTAIRARRFLTVSEGHFSAGLLTDPSAQRIILRGEARFTDTYQSGTRRVTTVRWTITLRRLA
jgi:hypothetical protein